MRTRPLLDSSELLRHCGRAWKGPRCHSLLMRISIPCCLGLFSASLWAQSLSTGADLPRVPATAGGSDLNPLMAAGVENGPERHPPSLLQITWAPKESIIRKARDSDNWPLTWGDDDALYTAYGDGEGFDPKLS